MTLINSMRVAWRSRDVGRGAASARGSRRTVAQGFEQSLRTAAADIPSPFDPMRKASKMLREWNDIIGEAFVGCVVEAAERRFSGELWSCRISAMNLVHIRAQRSRVERWVNDGPRTQSGSVLLHLLAAGQCISHQRGQCATLEPGDGVLCDPDHSYTTNYPTAHEVFIIELPVIDIVAREPGFDLERFAGRKVEQRRSQLLLNFLRTAWLQRDCLDEDPDWRDCVSRTSLDLAIRAISKAGGHEVVGASAELRRAVIVHIQQNLLDSGLRTSSIARALNVSPRSVQNVFEGGNTTTSGYILQQRLARAAERLIREPGRQSITGLAYDCGFSDSAYFSRCFSRHYGVAPRDYRRHGQTSDVRALSADESL
jgi:AraC-like DNA-binding protein